MLKRIIGIMSIIFICFSLEAKGKKHRYPRVYRSRFQPSWDERLDMQAIEDRLRNEGIADIQRISRYLAKAGKVANASDAMLLVSLESGMKGVFKPGEYHYAEVAAYRANKALGQRLVPPTVIREVNGKEGSLQFLVESPVDLRKVAHAGDLFRKVSAKDISDMKLFYFVFGQWDTHVGNQIITMHDGKGYLALIDNAGMLHRSYTRYGDYSFIEKGMNKRVNSVCTREFPFDNAKTIRPKSLNHIRSVLRPYITDSAIRKLWTKRQSITYCIWCDTLWMKMTHLSGKPSATTTYYASTLKAYEKLDRTMLERAWAEWLMVDRNHASELIELTLERRDQMLRAAYATGTIVNDLV